PTLYYSPANRGSRNQDCQRCEPAVESEVEELERLGQSALSEGRLDEAEAQFRRALQRRQGAGLGGQHGLPQAFGRLGMVAVARGDKEGARELFELGVDLARGVRAQ